MKSICDDVSKIQEEWAMEEIEDKYDLEFPISLKKFFDTNNGGSPKKQNIEINGKEYEIRCFLSFNSNEYNSVEKPADSFQKETNGKIFPFAKDSGDSYYCLNVESGEIYYWDREDELYYLVAKDFDEFIAYFK